MHVHEHPPDRRWGDLIIRQAFIVTLTGFFMTMLVIYAAAAPINVPGAFPLLDVPEARHGRSAPYTERDVLIAITRNGGLYLGNDAATLAQIAGACEIAARRRSDIYIRVDRSVDFGLVRDVIKAAQHDETTQVTFLVKPAASRFASPVER